MFSEKLYGIFSEFTPRTALFSIQVIHKMTSDTIWHVRLWHNVGRWLWRWLWRNFDVAVTSKAGVFGLLRSEGLPGVLKRWYMARCWMRSATSKHTRGYFKFSIMWAVLGEKYFLRGHAHNPYLRFNSPLNSGKRNYFWFWPKKYEFQHFSTSISLEYKNNCK